MSESDKPMNSAYQVGAHVGGGRLVRRTFIIALILVSSGLLVGGSVGHDRLGIAARIRHVRGATDIENAFSAMKAENAQAVFVLPDLMLAEEGALIAALALEQRLPTMAWGYW